ncbi:Predicted DNA-binding transcriptional regulator YafY, contains an HTH and WYL domains [Saccharopolyspora antimicrobica]|uniref:DNA-binding transcriptional regulator YafY n=1 Tax=Saccharopolyspora antimicrobica TaxID=455193 RepID=A0A1I4U277_9PSEU|nr:YafY family protein [Saccharopolyspora antimicrobica]RKT88644.1 putative DNA-binding transcriptional regulator YafY [Saccharopolyspora antimicrobica]SFM82987.1 Predicted DNA-binding transcriptional regulator YafY, contains an HTH and WYL domains [Saccharopolyspora antimicrobica]
MSDVTRRLLELLAHLQTGRRFSGPELAARLETSPRTVRRDVERLRDYGYPVTTQPGPGGFYRLAAGQALPPMVFDDEEAVATVVGLGVLAASAPPDTGGIGSAADRAFGKIDQFLPKRLRARAGAVRATFEAAAQTAPPVNADALATLAAAAARHEHVTFDYTARDGTTSQRRAEPYRQVHLHLRWYLLAWDRDRADWRTFRLDRISCIAVPGTRFEPRPLPAESAAEYLRGKLAEPRHRAVVTIHAPAPRVADALKFSDCAVEPLGPERCRITTWVDSFEWLVLNLAFLDADFVIEEPAEFRARCRELARRLGHASQTADGSSPGEEGA